MDKNKKNNSLINTNNDITAPEELGRLIRITKPGGFIALVIGIFMAGMAVVWSVYGFVPRKVDGFGILAPPGGVMDVVSLGKGEIVEIGISLGERVGRGQVIAKIQMTELENQRESALSELQDARNWLEKRSDYFEHTIEIQEKNNAERIKYLEFRKEYLSEYLDFLKDHLTNLEKLSHSGSITTKDYADARSSMNSVLAQTNQCDLDITRIKTEMIDLKSRSELELMQAEERISEVLLRIENLDRSIETMTRVISPYNGIVVEMSAERGDFVGQGSPIAVLKPEEPMLEAIIMIPLQKGKRVKPGMMAYVYPSTARKEEYGCIYGLVAYVSEYPVTAQALNNIIGNSQVINLALSQGEPMLLSRIALLRDTRTVSGFKWSSSMGPDREIEASTFTQVEVALDYSRPIDLIFPKFSRTFAFEE